MSCTTAKRFDMKKMLVLIPLFFLSGCWAPCKDQTSTNPIVLECIQENQIITPATEFVELTVQCDGGYQYWPPGE
jgi:hypothetical protein